MITTGLKISKTLLVMTLIFAVATDSAYVENATVDKTQSGVESAGQEVDSFMNRVGNFVGDSAIIAKVKVALVGRGSIKSIDILVKTDQKVVILSGFAEGQAQAEEAAKVAKGIEGVTFVSDRLRTHNSKDTFIRGYAGNMTITNEVKVGLLTDDAVPSREVKAKTTDGVVQLPGTVDSQAQSDRVESIAKMIDDVKSARNDLKTQ